MPDTKHDRRTFLSPRSLADGRSAWPAVALVIALLPMVARAQECPDSAPLYCASTDGCCPYGDGGRTDVCCPDFTCTRNGVCDDGPDPGPGPTTCPGSAPLYCSSTDGCCPYGDGGRTDVCCDDGTCTRNGSCGGPGPGPGPTTCPGSAPLYCASIDGCCPYGDGGRTDVCCDDGTCTRDGDCSGPGPGPDPDPVCPTFAPLYCASTDGCCPYGNGGRTDVCCDDGTCAANGVCGGGPPPRGSTSGGSSRSGGCSIALRRGSAGTLLFGVIAAVGLVVIRRRRPAVVRAGLVGATVLVAFGAIIGCTNGSAVSTAALSNGCTEVRRGADVTIACDPDELEAVLDDAPGLSAPRVRSAPRLGPRHLEAARRPIGRAERAAVPQAGLRLAGASEPSEGVRAD